MICIVKIQLSFRLHSPEFMSKEKDTFAFKAKPNSKFGIKEKKPVTTKIATKTPECCKIFCPDMFPSDA